VGQEPGLSRRVGATDCRGGLSGAFLLLTSAYALRGHEVTHGMSLWVPIRGLFRRAVCILSSVLPVAGHAPGGPHHVQVHAHVRGCTRMAVWLYDMLEAQHFNGTGSWY
jgi:hypothetical protein